MTSTTATRSTRDDEARDPLGSNNLSRRTLLRAGTTAGTALVGGVASTGSASAIEQTTPQWAVAYGNDGDDRLYGITPIDENEGGGYLAVGRVAFDGGEQYYGLVIRVGADGTRDWAQVLSELGPLELYHSCRAGDGDHLAVGYTDGPTPTARIVKLRADGEIRWDRSYGQERSLGLLGIDTTPSGEIVVTGGIANERVNGIEDLSLYTAGLTGDGSIRWQRRFPGLNVGLDVAAASDGVVVAGRTAGDQGGVIHYDDTGATEWSFATGEAMPTTALWAPDGDPIIAGRTGSEAFVARLTPTGAVRWEQSYGSDVGAILGQSAGVPYQGGFVFGGWTAGGLGATQDGYVLAIDSDGTERWSQRFGGANQEYVNEVLLGENDHLLVAGTSTSYGGGGGQNGYVASVSRPEAAGGPAEQSDGLVGDSIDISIDSPVDDSVNLLSLLPIDALVTVVGGGIAVLTWFMILAGFISGLTGASNSSNETQSRSSSSRNSSRSRSSSSSSSSRSSSSHSSGPKPRQSKTTSRSKLDDWDKDDTLNEYGERER